MEMELELKDYLKIVRKRLWLIVTVVILASVAAGIVSMYVLKPVYEASTKLIVNQSNESTAGMQQLDLNAVNLNLRLIDTYKEIIKTPAIMDKVMSEHPEFGLTAGELSDKVRVSSVNNTQVMTLIVEDGSYERAAAIVNAISVVFQREIPFIMNVDNVSILNEAPSNVSPSPVKPNVKLNIAIAFVVSLMVMLGIAFLLEYLDDTIKTERDVEAIIGLPTLTAIAKTTEEDFAHGAKSSKRKVTDKRAVLEQ
ncbi:Wzz/FepE/Etk N-terminal domain-containing protein [Paenibacillus sp.]|uniref:YveK family protein n=1 Tax=Paenibacillus sp. TaxID=58172 RepID=UPI0028115B79|nr:Wzz/FepE/Etk N-terminal domain-containing protein [Paenibacillus sp.]